MSYDELRGRETVVQLVIKNYAFLHAESAFFYLISAYHNRQPFIGILLSWYISYWACGACLWFPIFSKETNPALTLAPAGVWANLEPAGGLISAPP